MKEASKRSDATFAMVASELGMFKGRGQTDFLLRQRDAVAGGELAGRRRREGSQSGDGKSTGEKRDPAGTASEQRERVIGAQELCEAEAADVAKQLG